MSYDYNDEEYFDPIYSAYHRNCNPEACESGLKTKFMKPAWKKYDTIKFLRQMTDEEHIHIRDYLEDLELCPVCKQEIPSWDTLIHYCATNGQYAWFCHKCNKKLHKPKRQCWHKIPAWKRDEKSSDTEIELYNYIIANTPINIKNASIGLGWSYGKTRGAAMRLQAQNLITIEEIHDNNYKELVLSTNKDYT